LTPGLFHHLYPVFYTHLFEKEVGFKRRGRLKRLKDRKPENEKVFSKTKID
jgi:hypothetical protein